MATPETELRDDPAAGEGPAAPGDPGDPGEGPAAPGERPPPENRHRVARVVGSIGRLMMTSGVVILLLVAYQLWGTGLQTSRAQDDLAQDFDALLDGLPPTTEAPATTEGTTTGPPSTLPAEVAPTVAPPALGEVVGRFSIPAIGIRDRYVVEGTGTDQLKRGAAHYPGTPLPGQAGNAAVAGHRTTYGAPLRNVHKLKAGDEITFETLQGTFTYEVIDITIVDDRDTSVLEDKGDDRLTLTACHPIWSADQRIIVAAELVGNPVPELEGQAEAAEEALDQSRGGGTDDNAIDVFATEPALRFPGAWWGALCMALWALVRGLAFYGHRSRRFPRLLPYLVGTPVCLVVLYLFFESFSFEGFARTVGLSI